MRRDLMDILACPLCKSELRLDVTREEDAEVIEGTLTCTACAEAYPIAEGIPNLLPPDLRDAMAGESSAPSGH
ncbi:MAG: methytransferase partner Trm112 [Dehalococcoidia bacterium]